MHLTYLPTLPPFVLDMLMNLAGRGCNMIGYRVPAWRPQSS